MSVDNNQNQIPDFFKPILWSWDFRRIDSEKHKKTIIVNSINYGDLKHWRWIVNYYGKKQVKKVLTEIPFYELRQRVVPLVSIIFSIDKFNHAFRGNS